MKPSILIFSQSMYLGGVERSLLGLLDSIDYDRYDVDLFLMRHSGELMPYLNHKANILPEIQLIQAMIEEYQNLHFMNPDGSINAVGCPHLNTDVLERFGLCRNGKEQIVAGIHVYPPEWFNPLDSVTGKLTKTKNTYSIHWYSMSWLPWYKHVKVKIGRVYRRIKMAVIRHERQI